MQTKFYIPDGTTIGKTIVVSYSNEKIDDLVKAQAGLEDNAFGSVDGVLPQDYNGYLEDIFEKYFPDNDVIKNNIFFKITIGEFITPLMIIEPLYSKATFYSSIYNANVFEIANIFNLNSRATFSKQYIDLEPNEISIIDNSTSKNLAIKYTDDFSEEVDDEFATGVSTKTKRSYKKSSAGSQNLTILNEKPNDKVSGSITRSGIFR